MIHLRAVEEWAWVRGLDAPVEWLRGGGFLRLCRLCALWDPIAWGAERDRFASTHTTRVQNIWGTVRAGQEERRAA
eukprot:6192086-Pleurochrysis_carterae.AAC.1